MSFMSCKISKVVAPISDDDNGNNMKCVILVYLQRQKLFMIGRMGIWLKGIREHGWIRCLQLEGM